MREGYPRLEGTTLAHAQTRRTCSNILKRAVAWWTFVDAAGVEPTSNAAERPLRRAVLWRRRSWSTQSPSGSQFVARILATITSLRRQKRDVLDYLTAACIALTCDAKPPSWLPDSRLPERLLPNY